MLAKAGPGLSVTGQPHTHHHTPTMPALATPPGLAAKDLCEAAKRKRKPHFSTDPRLDEALKKIKQAEHDAGIHHRNHQNAEARVRELQAQLAEKDALIESLQQSLQKATETVTTAVADAKTKAGKGGGKGRQQLTEADVTKQAEAAKAQTTTTNTPPTTTAPAAPIVSPPADKAPVQQQSDPKPTTTTDDEDEVADSPTAQIL